MTDPATRIEAATAFCAGHLAGATAHLKHDERLEVFRRLIGPNRPVDHIALRLFVHAADTYIAAFAAYRAAGDDATAALIGKIQQLSREYETARASVMEMLKLT